MGLREHIVRGLRLGLILLALLIAGVAAYRISKASPPAPPPVTHEDPPAPVATPKVPDARFNGPSMPPPPPAAGRKTTQRFAAPPVVTAPVAVEAPPPVPEPEPEKKIAPAEAAVQPEPAQEKIEDLPEPVVQPVAKSPSKPKRWIHAVGRFLHVVH